METMFRICPRPCERFFPRGHRIERSLRATMEHAGHDVAKVQRSNVVGENHK
jgi:hypothetical protein